MIVEKLVKTFLYEFILKLAYYKCELINTNNDY